MWSSNRGLWIALGVALVLVGLAFVPMFGTGMRPGMLNPGYAPLMAPGLWGFGLLVRLLFWGVLIALIFSAFRGFNPGRPWGPRYDQSPEEILRRRYAAGEISREQFEEMRQHLTGAPPASAS